MLKKLQSFLPALGKGYDTHRMWVNPDCGLKTREWQQVSTRKCSCSKHATDYMLHTCVPWLWLQPSPCLRNAADREICAGPASVEEHDRGCIPAAIQQVMQQNAAGRGQDRPGSSRQLASG